MLQQIFVLAAKINLFFWIFRMVVPRAQRYQCSAYKVHTNIHSHTIVLFYAPGILEPNADNAFAKQKIPEYLFALTRSRMSRGLIVRDAARCARES